MTASLPVSFALPAGAAPVACVDIGGTKVAVAIVDARGVQGRLVEPTIKQGASDALARQVLRMIGASCQAAHIAPGAISAVGVASCGPFVLNQGRVELSTPNICGGLAGSARGLPNDWRTAVLEAPLHDAFPRVRVENDGVAALQAERRWGALQGIDHCAYVTWSTGIGAGLCVDGRVLRGKNGNAGHAGHMFVVDNADALCGCGNVGDLEALVAGNALPRRFVEYADAAAILIAAKAGDAKAKAIIDGVCRIMGRALYNLIATLDLERISLGGSVFWHHRDYLLPRLQAEIRGKLPALTDGCTLVEAGLGERVGDGAALALVA
ncbi:MAG: glucokinase [Polaromonas sp.]|jgi:glucokinase|nr:glucokinase [Polaromonas sp.]